MKTAKVCALNAARISITVIADAASNYAAAVKSIIILKEEVPKDGSTKEKGLQGQKR